MVYHVTRRPFWHATRGGMRFLGTTLLLGLATVLLSAIWSLGTGDAGSVPSPRVVFLSWYGLAVAAVLKLASEAAILRHLRDAELTPLKRSALLFRGPLSRLAIGRFALGGIGGMALPMGIAVFGFGMPMAVVRGLAMLAFVMLVAGEFLERTLFFTAVTRPKMPGGGHS